MKTVPFSRYVGFLLIAVGGLSWDLYSKAQVFEALGAPAGRSAWVKLWLDGRVRFQLYTSFNEGALWGFGQGLSWLFATLSLLAAGGILYWLFVHGSARSWWLTVALALIMAGTLGNLYDRLGLHGYENPETGETYRAVRDFLYFHFFPGTRWDYPWPIFNFADVFLVTGAIMLVLQSFGHEANEVAASSPGSKQAQDAPAV